jgi:steroid delta-isomerase-like uncharacterized protein
MSLESMIQNNHKEVVRTFFEIYNTRNYELAYQCLAEDYMDHSLPQVRSLEDAIAILRSTHQSFPDICVVIDDLIAEHEHVVFRGRFSATHLGDFLGHPASGARVEFEAIEIFKVKERKIIESWGYWPSGDIVKQIVNRELPLK